jgi:hypothetical protein
MFPHTIRDLHSGRESRVTGIRMLRTPAGRASDSSDDVNGSSSSDDSSSDGGGPPPTPHLPEAQRPARVVQLGTEAIFAKDCGICLTKIKDGDRVTVLIACRHMAHTECLRECYASTRKSPIISAHHHKCPFCRATIKFPSKRHQQPAPPPQPPEPASSS